jgi:hypothetical protein
MRLDAKALALQVALGVAVAVAVAVLVRRVPVVRRLVNGPCSCA